MTLEQIKNKQQLLNDNLREHVRKSDALTDTILGSSPVPFNDEARDNYTPNGLLDGLAYEQDITRGLLQELYSHYERLFSQTYAPMEDERKNCAVFSPGGHTREELS